MKKEKSQEINVDKYLNQMEHMERNGNVFARIIDDKQAIREEEEKQIVFYTEKQIEGKIVEGIRKSAYVARVEETVELVGKGAQGGNFQILALENEELENFKRGQCLTSSLFLKNNDLEVGDKIVLPVYCYAISMMTGELTERFMGDYEWEIAGSCEMEEDIHIPLEHAKELFVETKNTYYASSLSFRVKEPKLLNELKAEMQALGLQEIQSGAKENFYGKALGIEDATFIEASIKLENNKTLLQSFLPVILLLLLVAEYLVSHLLLQSRRQEFAIMRALGKSKKDCRRSLMTEQSRSGWKL